MVEKKEQAEAKTETPAAAPSVRANRAPGAVPKVNWDDTNMTTSYANVVNVASTREEVTLFFGTNQTWNIRGSGTVTVQLSDRIVLNPYAAKRLWTLLGSVLNEYESRYGELALDTGAN